MKQRWRRFYERHGIEPPFPWIVLPLLPAIFACALYDRIKRWLTDAE